MIHLKGRKVAITALAFSPDGARLAAACYRGLVQLFDLHAAKLERAFVVGDGLTTSDGIFFLPQGDALLAYDWTRGARAGPTLRAVTLEGRSLGLRPKTTRAEVRRAAAAEGRAALAVAHLSSVVLYSLPDFAPLWRVAAPNSANALACTPDGRTVALGQEGGGVRLFREGGELPPLPTPRREVKALAVSPDGDGVATGGNTHLRLWRLTRQPREVKHVQLGKTHFLDVAWHPSGSFLATANGDGKVDFWDWATGERRESFDWGVGKVSCVVFDRAGDRAACCSEAGDVVIWDVDL